MCSCVPPITVPAWSCMMSSHDPGSLGIYGFRNRTDHSYLALDLLRLTGGKPTGFGTLFPLRVKRAAFSVSRTRFRCVP